MQAAGIIQNKVYSISERQNSIIGDRMSNDIIGQELNVGPITRHAEMCKERWKGNVRNLREMQDERISKQALK